VFAMAIDLYVSVVELFLQKKIISVTAEKIVTRVH
jgi:hypothetical protein